jgi:hypothetical protein
MIMQAEVKRTSWNKGLTKETDPRVKVTKGSSGMRKDFALKFWSKVDKNAPNGCWEWIGCRTGAGYGQIRISGEVGQSKAVSVHVLSWEMANGLVPDGMDVLHHCDNPVCVRPEHLFLGTQHDNVQDMMQKGRYVLGVRLGNQGEKHPLHKLTEKQVLDIKKALADNSCSTAELARKYGVAYMTVYSIKRGYNWKYLDVE